MFVYTRCVSGRGIDRRTRMASSTSTPCGLSKVQTLLKVLVVCILLLLLVWNSGLTKLSRRTALRPPNPAVRDDSADFPTVTHQTTSWTKSQPPACTINQDLKVLGRVLDRCSTEEAARLAVEEDIYVSVKTTARYHSNRMLPSLQTWFQSLPADRVIII